MINSQTQELMDTVFALGVLVNDLELLVKQDQVAIYTAACVEDIRDLTYNLVLLTNEIDKIVGR